MLLERMIEVLFIMTTKDNPVQKISATKLKTSFFWEQWVRIVAPTYFFVACWLYVDFTFTETIVAWMNMQTSKIFITLDNRCIQNVMMLLTTNSNNYRLISLILTVWTLQWRSGGDCGDMWVCVQCTRTCSELVAPICPSPLSLKLLLRHCILIFLFLSLSLSLSLWHNSWKRE